ncbi:MAG: GNAT family N-acetyltransferase [Gemmataceae bacterium]|nr:GNAT family N-acetyltransferase [Gemmataceae bacterium]MDW8243261.1 GNAT family N-acetyltransferase [Thermogemmata sp.]
MSGDGDLQCRPGQDQAGTVIAYRHFRNTDPPALADVWNESHASRSSYPVRTPALLERWIFSKPYFDPRGLIVAVDTQADHRVVGYVLAGFGPNAELNALDYSQGVICLLAVRPAYRRRGIARELIRRAEHYLLAHGATTLRAGPRWPYCPFGFGLYGGTNCPGFLASDPGADPLFRSLGYRPAGTTLVFHKRLDSPLSVADVRFQLHRRRYEILAIRSAVPPTWWHECVWGTLEPVEFRLTDKLANQFIAGRVLVWELEGYGWRWGLPAAGVLDIQIREDLRRQGLGKFLMVQVLRFLQEQYFGLCEVQAADTQPELMGLCRSLGMEQVDCGTTYIKSATEALPPPELSQPHAARATQDPPTPSTATAESPPSSTSSSSSIMSP